MYINHANMWYLQFAWEQALKLLLQAESEGQPAHVGGLTALPEVNHTLEVFFRLFVLIVSLFLFLLIILILHWHPVPKHTQISHILLKHERLKYLNSGLKLSSWRATALQSLETISSKSHLLGSF